MTSKSKVVSTKTPAFAKGGKGHMFGKQAAVSQSPGTTTHAGAKGGKFAKGGGGKMFGKQAAVSQAPGTTSHKGR